MKQFCLLLMVILLAKFEARAQYAVGIVVTHEGTGFDTTMRTILLNTDKKKYSKLTAVYKKEGYKHISERTAWYSFVNDSLIKTNYTNWTAKEKSENSPNCGTLVIRNGYISEKLTDGSIRPYMSHKDSAGYRVTYTSSRWDSLNISHAYKREQLDDKGKVISRYEMAQFPFPTLYKCKYSKDSVKTDSLFFYSKYGEPYIYCVEKWVVRKVDAMHSIDSIAVQLFEVDYSKKTVPGRIGYIVINNTYNAEGLLVKSDYAEAGFKYSMNLTYEK